MNAAFRAILFDWDGTLVDTAEASFRCYVRMFARFGIDFDRAMYERTYSPNWYRTFELLGLAREHWNDADDAWLEHFAEETIELIADAREALEHLGERGVARGIVTSGSRGRVLRELAAYGVAHHFDEVVFGCDVEHKKPHPASLYLCLERLKVAPKDAAYIGDSPEDVEMARAAGVFAVAVPGAYPNREQLLASKPDLVMPSVAAAVRALTTA